MDFVKKEWQFRDLISENELNRMEDGIEEGITKAEQAQQIANEAKTAADDAQSDISAHISATTGVHGATSAATPNTLVQRDPAGRFKAAAPSASDDVARKAEVDTRAPLSGAVFTGPVEYSSNPRESTDLNNEINPGWVVFTANTANRPDISGFSNYGVVRIERRTSNRVAQTAYGLTGNMNAQIAIRVLGNDGWSQWYKVWNESNDGAGSGLDADLLDGMQSDRFIFGDNERGSVLYSSGNLNDITKSGFYHTSSSVLNHPPGINSGFCLHIQHPSSNVHAIQIFQGGIGNNAQFYVRRKSDTGWGDWGKLWTEFNDGAGSGLDADLLDGMQPSTSATANTIVQRDPAGQAKFGTPSDAAHAATKGYVDATFVPVAGGSISGNLVFQNTGTGLQLRRGDQESRLHIADFPEAETVDIEARFFRNSNTSGNKDVTIFRGDGTATSTFRIRNGKIDRLDGQNITIAAGPNSPEGSISAPPGSLYLRTNGEMWLKKTGTGNTGWGQVASEIPYETGTWTPELRFDGSTAGITYEFRAGRYTRIANVVYWTFEIWLSSKGSASGVATIAGLPFNKVDVLDFYHSVGRASNISVPSGQWLSSYVRGTIVHLVTNTISPLTNAEFSNNSRLCASGFYFIS